MRMFDIGIFVFALVAIVMAIFYEGRAKRLNQELAAAVRAYRNLEQTLLAVDIGEKLNLVHFRRAMELEARYKKVVLCLHEVRSEAQEYKDRLNLICNARRIGKPHHTHLDMAAGGGRWWVLVM